MFLLSVKTHPAVNTLKQCPSAHNTYIDFLAVEAVLPEHVLRRIAVGIAAHNKETNNNRKSLKLHIKAGINGRYTSIKSTLLMNGFGKRHTPATGAA